MTKTYKLVKNKNGFFKPIIFDNNIAFQKANKTSWCTPYKQKNQLGEYIQINGSIYVPNPNHKK